MTTTGTIQSIERAAAVLKSVAGAGAEGARLKDISAQTLMPPTAHRLCKAMLREGWLSQPTGQRRYFLGQFQPTLDKLSQNRSRIVDAGRRAVRRLAHRTGDTAYLFLCDGIDVLCIDRCEGDFMVKALAVNVGDWRPMGLGAAGMAVLAAMAEQDRAMTMDLLLAHRPEVAERGRDWLEDNIQRTKQHGFTFARTSGLVSGVYGIAAPWPETVSLGAPFGALSVVAIQDRLDEDRRIEVAAAIKEECTAIHRFLDHQEDKKLD